MNSSQLLKKLSSIVFAIIFSFVSNHAWAQNLEHQNTEQTMQLPTYHNLRSYLLYTAQFQSTETMQELVTYLQNNNISLDSEIPELIYENNKLLIPQIAQAEISGKNLIVQGSSWNPKNYQNLEKAINDLVKKIKTTSQRKNALTFLINQAQAANSNKEAEASYKIAAALFTMALLAATAPVAVPAAAVAALTAGAIGFSVNGIVHSGDSLFSNLRCTSANEITLDLGKKGTLFVKKNVIYVKTDQKLGQGYAGKFNDNKLIAELQKSCKDEKYKADFMKRLNEIKIPDLSATAAKASEINNKTGSAQ